MKVEVKVLNKEDIEKFFKNTKQKIAKDTEKAVFRSTLLMQNEVKLSIAGQKQEPASVDTGRFLNSIDIRTIKNEGLVFTDIEYAKFLEYGTSRIKSRSHFRNSLYRNKTQIKNIFKESIYS